MMNKFYYQKPRKLYVIRNVSGRATRKAVMAAEALKFGLIVPDLGTIIPEFRVEDTNLPSYASTELHNTLCDALPKILLGENPRWKLWEGEIHTDRIVLHYVDMENVAATRTKNTDLSCFMFWRKGVDIQLEAPSNSDVFPNYFRLWFSATQENEGYLSVVYPSEATTDDGHPLVNDETYDIRPGRG